MLEFRNKKKTLEKESADYSNQAHNRELTSREQTHDVASPSCSLFTFLAAHLINSALLGSFWEDKQTSKATSWKCSNKKRPECFILNAQPWGTAALWVCCTTAHQEFVSASDISSEQAWSLESFTHWRYCWTFGQVSTVCFHTECTTHSGEKRLTEKVDVNSLTH